MKKYINQYIVNCKIYYLYSKYISEKETEEIYNNITNKHSFNRKDLKGIFDECGLDYLEDNEINDMFCYFKNVDTLEDDNVSKEEFRRFYIDR